MSRAIATALATTLAVCTPTDTPPPVPVTAPPAPTPAAPVATTTPAAVAPVRPAPTPPRVPAPVRRLEPVDAGGAADHTARASWYARGARTANGERFDPDGPSYASRSDGFGTLTEFCHEGSCVIARCNDRGPDARTGRLFDLSRGAFSMIAPLSAGVVDVTWRRV